IVSSPPFVSVMSRRSTSRIVGNVLAYQSSSVITPTKPTIPGLALFAAGPVTARANSYRAPLRSSLMFAGSRATGPVIWSGSLSSTRLLVSQAARDRDKSPTPMLHRPPRFTRAFRFIIDNLIPCSGSEVGVEAHREVPARRQRVELRHGEVRLPGVVDLGVEPGVVGPRLQVPAGQRE